MKIGTENKTYQAVIDGRGIFIVHPSKKHPGYWWACNIHKGMWEGFTRPIRSDFLPEFISRWKIEDSQWRITDWDGSDMWIPPEKSPKKIQSNRIYFLEAENYGLVKIGLATDSPTSRITTIQAMSPVLLRLLGDIPGNAKKERSFHKRFSHQRSHGEWFYLTAELKQFIASQLCQKSA